jgi:hypothetical protein
VPTSTPSGGPSVSAATALATRPTVDRAYRRFVVLLAALALGLGD